ncbi:hypothetical protein AB0H92_15795 [Streptomyces phaeochromogenes]|uniref:DUF2076 domain-containing protein n=1 Tax=Streptomyces phaeochromogenes TaxID=1923 RepID=A0ABZ1HE28_STRPH|nr:hypothetical protein [Streptomyces phaeochromogenes]MCX5605011.1 DUF2076 domain-containing protein [Streptomyces phaeochromogenes]WRZ30850.1 DUF2076 domain-containing protein [Streptomyces phaeochromogenes]WSD16445.1 DUF2076 domain-containing protein [Streptomyces phaeochromogenes]WSJ06738.1 DUF2076 domain-containing protein [Streptomyces phaeochromogenes]WSS94965.1 DUF2076 domain-containing protein [Streptomyces phaeochromogenes]
MTTPPPQGQNPFAQGQPPQGQNPYGQPPSGNPYGQPQPGDPQQSPSPYFNQGAPVPPPAAPARSGFKKYLRFIIPVAALSIAAGTYFFGGDDATKLQAGDCLRNTGSDSNATVEKLDCSDSKATHKVLAKKDGSSLAQLACQSVQGTTAALSWQEGSDSFVLCLADNK